MADLTGDVPSIDSIAASIAESAGESDRPFLGRAIVNGRIRFLSVSQVVAFDANQEGGCPRRWAYEKIFGKKADETQSQKDGKVNAKFLEVYLKTGQDVLPPHLRVAKHLLPKPGPDLDVERELSGSNEELTRALQLRDQILKTANKEQLANLRVELLKAAKLVVHDIPFIGAADFRHRRGVYVENGGTLHREPYGDKVVECGDHKGTSQINAKTSRNGKTYPGFAKTVEQILNHPQMLGYGVHAHIIHPDATHVRLAHQYFQTKNGYHAEKRHGLLEVGECVRRWETSVYPIVREMIDITYSATKPEDVPGNGRSCVAFHKPCAHSDYCDKPVGTVHDLLQIGKKEEIKMSGGGLFDDFSPAPTNGVTTSSSAGIGLFGGAVPALSVTTPSPTPPPLPVKTEEQHRAETEAAKQQWLAQAAQTTQPPPLPVGHQHPGSLGIEGYKPGQGCNGHGFYKNANGQGYMNVEPGHVCHAGCEKRPPVGGVNPADGPPVNPLDAAAPLPASEIANIQNPQLQLVVAQHAQEHAARAAAEEAAKPKKEKTGGRCPGGGKQLSLTKEEGVRRRKACPDCGKVYDKIKDKSLTILSDGDTVVFVVPNHNLPKDEALTAASPQTVPSVVSAPPPLPQMQPATAPPALPVQAAPTPPPLPQQTEAPSTPPPVPGEMTKLVDSLFGSETTNAVQVPAVLAASVASIATGRKLYVDVIFKRGDQPVALDSWLADIVNTIEKACGVEDIRLGDKDSILGYGRWRGWLAKTIRANLPPPGRYMLRNYASNEIVQEAVHTLEAYCDEVVVK